MTDAVIEKKFELRALKASDFFLVTRILSKIGVKEFKQCFENDDIKTAVKNMMDNQDGAAISEGDVASIGVSVVLDIASIVLENMDKCETDIYRLLASLSDKEWTAIREMPMADFTEMVMEVIKHEGFRDFFTAVIKQFK